MPRSMITVDAVSKTFKLPHEKHSSLKSTLINLRRGNKGYETQQVLKKVSFDVKEGEFFGIVGRNGSGKSTLLKMLAEIYSPTEGSIVINGKLTPFIELGVGFNPELTGRENVFLNGALLGFNRKEMDVMYDDIVEFSEIERFMDQKLKNYSSGMQVRLAFSIAIRAQSDILLLDEVLAVGDAAFQRKCFDYFMDLKKNKKTVILVTHDMSAVRQYCDRAIMIEKGEIVHQGSPEKVAQEYQKLFNDESQAKKSKTVTEADQNRWGEGGIQASKVTATLAAGILTIVATYKADKPMPAPIYGFTLFGPDGTNIMESNTFKLKVKTHDLASGENVTFTWSVADIFANGNYSISVACCDQTTTRFYDWLDGAARFSVRKENATAGLVEPEVRLSENEKGVVHGK